MLHENVESFRLQSSRELNYYNTRYSYVIIPFLHNDKFCENVESVWTQPSCKLNYYNATRL